MLHLPCIGGTGEGLKEELEMSIRSVGFRRVSCGSSDGIKTQDRGMSHHCPTSFHSSNLLLSSN